MRENRKQIRGPSGLAAARVVFSQFECRTEIAAQWIAAQWIAAQWIAAQWIAAKWIAAKWIAAKWIAAKWIAANWCITEQSSMSENLDQRGQTAYAISHYPSPLAKGEVRRGFDCPNLLHSRIFVRITPVCETDGSAVRFEAMLFLDILFEDDNLIAVNKPSGLLVIPDRWDPTVPTIQDMLREYLRKHSDREHPNIRVIHRLDRDTSGVVVLAKNVKAQSYLGKQFEKGEVDKTYHCVVSGVISKDEGVINFSLSQSNQKSGMMVVDPKGKKSITLFRVLERFDGFTYVEAKPLTGRTHQVRMHLKASGYPLALDPLYGESAPVFLSQIKRNYRPKDAPEKPVFSRLPLHAFRISFREPAEGSTVVLEAPLPKDFQRMLKLLRKYKSLPGAEPREVVT